MLRIQSQVSRLLMFFSLIGTINACGNKSDGAGGSYPFIDRIALGHQTLSYALSVLASTNKSAPTSSLDMLLDLSAQDPALTSCSTQGEPWSNGAIMQPSHEKYVPTVMYCEVNSKISSRTIAGSLDYYRRILCEAERSIGSVEYIGEGKEYTGRIISATEACGWPEDLIATWQPLTAKITAYAPSSGDWQKHIKVEAPQKIAFDLWYTITNDLVSFKLIEEWNQAYPSNGESHDAISATATGTRGTVFSLDASNGIMRTESIDTYWGHRFRYYTKGSLDGNNGTFNSTSDGQAISSSFDRPAAGFNGKVATLDGNDADGFYYSGYSYSSSLLSDIRGAGTSITSKTGCSVSVGCSGQTRVPFGTENGDFDFLLIGAAWDGQINSRTTAQNWLVGSGFINFASVTKAKTL